MQRRKHSGHLSLVCYGHAGHAATAGADGIQRILEGQSAGGDQCSVLSQAVSHGHVGLNAVSGQQPGQGEINGQHGRLSNSGLAQIFVGFGDGGGVGSGPRKQTR